MSILERAGTMGWTRVCCKIWCMKLKVFNNATHIDGREVAMEPVDPYYTYMYFLLKYGADVGVEPQCCQSGLLNQVIILPSRFV